MFSFLHTFAGVTPKSKAMVADSESIYYISSSNVIVCKDEMLRPIQNVIHFKDTLSCIAYSSSAIGKARIAVGDTAGKLFVVRISELTNKDFKSEILSVHSISNQKIQDCCFVSDEIVVCCTLRSIHILNCKTSEIKSIETDFIVGVLQFVQGRLFVGSNLGTIHIYAIENESVSLSSSVEAHQDAIKDIKSSGDFVATCSQDTNVKIWKYSGKELVLIQTLNGHSDWVNGLCWFNSVLYSASADKTIRIWSNVSTGYACVDILGASSELLGIVSLNERVFVYAKTGGIDKVQDFEYFVSGHLSEITDLDWRENILATCSLDRTTRLFYRGKECFRAQIHGFPITSVKFLPGDRLRIVSSAQETIMRIYEATQAFFSVCEEIEMKQTDDVSSIAEIFKPDDDYVKSAYLSELNLTNEICQEDCFDTLSENYLSTSVFRELKKIYGHYFEIKNIAVGSNLILSCNRSALKKFAGLFVWSLEGVKRQYIEEHELGIQKIAISPDQSFAATVGRDCLACLYSISNQELKTIKRFKDHERIIWDCKFNRDGKILATCSRDGKVILYSTETLEMINECSFGIEVTTLDFSPTNDLLIIGTEKGEIVGLDSELNVISKIQAVSQKVTVARFDFTGNKIAVGGADGLIRILSVE